MDDPPFRIAVYLSEKGFTVSVDDEPLASFDAEADAVTTAETVAEGLEISGAKVVLSRRLAALSGDTVRLPHALLDAPVCPNTFPSA